MRKFIVIYDGSECFGWEGTRESITDVYGNVEANSPEEALAQVDLDVDGINIYSVYCYELASDEVFFKTKKKISNIQYICTVCYFFIPIYFNPI